ncbi:MAG: hypothetical protein HDR98_01115 [Bacteroides sp.]|nr:hypothetical protein [Bacteroides sp.]
MNTVNMTKDPYTDAGICQVAGVSIRGFQAEHEQRVRKWLCQSPFASLWNALKNGTRSDQLSCMRQVEDWLLRCLPAALYGQYTRKRYLEDLQWLSRLVGLTFDSEVLKAYRNTTQRKRMTQVS